jgi:hypothetical protein
MKNRNLEHSDHWKTPDWFYNGLDAMYHFDFDPCPLHCEVDNLAPDAKWGKMNYVNPGYSREVKEAFVERCVAELHEKGHSSIVLLPAATSTKLFHGVIWKKASSIYFPNARINFAGYNTKGEYVKNGSGQMDLMIVEFWLIGRTAPAVDTLDIKSWRPKKRRKNEK